MYAAVNRDPNPGVRSEIPVIGHPARSESNFTAYSGFQAPSNATQEASIRIRGFTEAFDTSFPQEVGRNLGVSDSLKKRKTVRFAGSDPLDGESRGHISNFSFSLKPATFSNAIEPQSHSQTTLVPRESSSDFSESDDERRSLFSQERTRLGHPPSLTFMEKYLDCLPTSRLHRFDRDPPISPRRNPCAHPPVSSSNLDEPSAWLKDSQEMRIDTTSVHVSEDVSAQTSFSSRFRTANSSSSSSYSGPIPNSIRRPSSSSESTTTATVSSKPSSESSPANSCNSNSNKESTKATSLTPLSFYSVGSSHLPKVPEPTVVPNSPPPALNFNYTRLETKLYPLMDSSSSWSNQSTTSSVFKLPVPVLFDGEASRGQTIMPQNGHPGPGPAHAPSDYGNRMSISSLLTSSSSFQLPTCSGPNSRLAPLPGAEVNAVDTDPQEDLVDLSDIIIDVDELCYHEDPQLDFASNSAPVYDARSSELQALHAGTLSASPIQPFLSSVAPPDNTSRIEDSSRTSGSIQESVEGPSYPLPSRRFATSSTSPESSLRQLPPPPWAKLPPQPPTPPSLKHGSKKRKRKTVDGDESCIRSGYIHLPPVVPDTDTSFVPTSAPVITYRLKTEQGQNVMKEDFMANFLEGIEFEKKKRQLMKEKREREKREREKKKRLEDLRKMGYLSGQEMDEDEDEDEGAIPRRKIKAQSSNAPGVKENLDPSVGGEDSEMDQSQSEDDEEQLAYHSNGPARGHNKPANRNSSKARGLVRTIQRAPATSTASASDKCDPRVLFQNSSTPRDLQFKYYSETSPQMSFTPHSKSSSSRPSASKKSLKRSIGGEEAVRRKEEKKAAALREKEEKQIARSAKHALQFQIKTEKQMEKDQQANEKEIVKATAMTLKQFKKKEREEQHLKQKEIDQNARLYKEQQDRELLELRQMVLQSQGRNQTDALAEGANAEQFQGLSVLSSVGVYSADATWEYKELGGDIDSLGAQVDATSTSQ